MKYPLPLDTADSNMPSADCFVEYSKVEIGFTTENAVKAVRKNVSDKQLLDFRLSCRNYLKQLLPSC